MGNFWDGATVEQKLLALRNYVESCEQHVWHGHAREAIAQLGAAYEMLPLIAPDLVEMGVRADMSQRDIARLLGVPESALRGARKEFAR